MRRWHVVPVLIGAAAVVPGDDVPALWIDAHGFERLEREEERRPTKAGSVIDLGEFASRRPPTRR